MNLTYNGKIGRQPRPIQEQLNRRLQNGEKGRVLVKWLNSLPEVQAVLAREFAGKPIRQQNLSEWRKHGYVKWLRQQEALDMVRQLGGDVGELQPPGAPLLADQMAVWLTARILVVVQKLAEKDHAGELDLKDLRELLRDAVAVCRGEHSRERLKMEQERLERDREKTEEEVVAHFERWAKNPEVRDLICQNYLTPEEREARLREIFGRPPRPAGDDGSSPVKPGQTILSNGHDEDKMGPEERESAIPKFMACRQSRRSKPTPPRRNQPQSNSIKVNPTQLKQSNGCNHRNINSSQ